VVDPKHLRVLVVEDNRDSAESLRRLLELCGYAVTIAETAKEGLDAAKSIRPDVILCDIGLPDSDGSPSRGRCASTRRPRRPA
jgi:CheY-like chemotaxis protein